MVSQGHFRTKKIFKLQNFAMKWKIHFLLTSGCQHNTLAGFN